MKRVLTFAVLSLLALSSTAFAEKGSKGKQQNQTYKPQPIVRDHRTPQPQPIVRDHRKPTVAPIVRDHRNSGSFGQGKPQYGYNGQSKPDLSNKSGGVYVNNNGVFQRAPAAANKSPLLSHPISDRVPPRDPRKPLSSQDLVSPGAKDQRFTPVMGSGPVVRDHRDQSGYGYRYPGYGKPNVSNMPGGVMVTSTSSRPGVQRPKPLDTKVTVAPDLSVRGPGPIVRDHRTPTVKPVYDPRVPSNAGANYKWPSFNQSTNATVRDHRGNGSATASGGVSVTTSARPRQPVDNTVYGTGPGLHSVVDAGMNGLAKIGNVFGIGYGSVTSGAPTRPQVVDHRNR